jgi:peptidoglycan/xylan/chitin deacetylase (PgdA/CDA1 family)
MKSETRVVWMKTLSFRFDIDTVADVHEGVPELLKLAKELNIHFSFYVNMGRSFSWKFFAIRQSRSLLKRLLRRGELNRNRARRIGVFQKLGLVSTLDTIVRNQKLGTSYREQLHGILDAGHELGLHGGMNHAVWQYNLDRLTNDQIEHLFVPAYESFSDLFGKPEGFCSPGFVHNRHVLELLDRYDFLYAADMDGEIPFHPSLGNRRYLHFQIPVNVIGNHRVSLISQLLAGGMSDEEIARTVLTEIKRRTTAVMYGHPSIEGVRAAEILKDIIVSARAARYEIITLRQLASQIGGSNVS